LLTKGKNEERQTRMCVGLPVTEWGNANCHFAFVGTTRTLIRCYDVPKKGSTMTDQSQPAQHNQSPGQKPGQQQGGGQKPGQQSQAPAKGDKNPKESHDQRSD
jgi:hypothetical protein